MLAVRRPGVTAALVRFVNDGLIVTSRGRISVINRDRMREIAGAFYGAPGAEYERLFGNGSAIPR